MKKFVFIRRYLHGMGGAQMYIRNKVLYLQERGWSVEVVSALKGETMIPELKRFGKCIPELEYPYYVIPSVKKKRILHDITKNYKEDLYEEIVIESDGIVESGWGEAIARKLGAKHIIYLLQEINMVPHRGMQSFFTFKLKRKEIAGITDLSLLKMFSFFSPIHPNQSYYLEAPCTNVVADVDSPIIKEIDTKRYDFVVGCLSRLDKPFIMPAIKDFSEYANKNKNKSFLLLLIGGSSSDVVSNIKDYICQFTNNVEIVITGYIYPVPIKLLDRCDVFFSSAGSAWLCMQSGIPTISYDGNDYKPIGIMGRTTNNFLYRSKKESPQDFSNLMNEILIYRKYPKMPSTYIDDSSDFKSHIDFIVNSSKTILYYDIDNLRPESSRETVDKLALTFIGSTIYAGIRKFLRSCKKKQINFER